MNVLRVVFLQKNEVSPVFPVKSSLLFQVAKSVFFFSFGFSFFVSSSRSLARPPHIPFVFVTDQQNFQ